LRGTIPRVLVAFCRLIAASFLIELKQVWPYAAYAQPRYFRSSVPPAQAQQLLGTPGSPEATETISGKQLLPPPQEFKGKIERNAAQSKPY
jgi:hypothetical protein